MADLNNDEEFQQDAFAQTIPAKKQIAMTSIQ